VSLTAGRAPNAAFGSPAIPQLLVLLVTLRGLIQRILDEEQQLSHELREYREYTHQLRYPPIGAPCLARRSGRRR
jgi:protein-S-isoprenylcysteine O-methyltransferase Ste14